MKKKKLRKKLKGWSFCSDGFGPMSIMTIQHPQKEAEDAFWLPSSHKLGFMSLFHDFNKLSFGFYFSITADIEYKIVGAKRHKNADIIRMITKMKIDSIEMLATAPDCDTWIGSK